jgi:hypothetical protein
VTEDGGGISGSEIIYNTTKGSAVSIDAGDIAGFFNDTYSSSTLTYVKLGGIPDTGYVCYNYSGSSSFGSSSAVKLTSSNYKNYTFYYNPTSKSLYTLSALTYVPSGTNYCVSIPFTAYYSSSKYVEGTILINVTTSSVSGIYYATVKNAKVSLSADDFTSAIYAATSNTASYIQFIELPSTSAGTLYYNYTSASSYGHKVNTSYSYYCGSSGTYRLSNITFVPYTGFTGSAAVPIVAYNSSGTAIAVGELSFGVVSSIKSYSDLEEEAWYYKYVVELSDSGVVDGYTNGTFQPGGTVTCGEALKLIMLAAGYSEQAATGSHWASGYLKKALSEELLSSSVDLDTKITRLEIAEIAAKALDLEASAVSSPFTDTSDKYVLELYENGIVEGSFNSSGVRYYYPSTTITRAEISAIIWRMNNLAGG